jgi:hypothetical protein
MMEKLLNVLARPQEEEVALGIRGEFVRCANAC